MNTTFAAAFDEGLAQVERVIENPTDAPGWGSDLACADDLAPDFAELSGKDPRVIAEFTYRRMNTRAGQLADDPDWGIDIEELLDKGMSPQDIVRLRNVLRGEIARDDRLRDVTAEASYNATTEQLELVVGAGIVDSDNSFLLTTVVSASGSNLFELLINGNPVATT
jgi:hypothetical protein